MDLYERMIAARDRMYALDGAPHAVWAPAYREWNRLAQKYARGRAVPPGRNVACRAFDPEPADAP